MINVAGVLSNVQPRVRFMKMLCSERRVHEA